MVQYEDLSKKMAIKFHEFQHGHDEWFMMHMTEEELEEFWAMEYAPQYIEVA